jgi:hypothetical protein
VTLFSESPDTSDSSDFHLAQVDPPHPFRNAWKTFLAATIVLLIAASLLAYFVHRPPIYAGEVTHVDYYQVPTTVNSGNSSMVGMQGSSETFNQLIILATVRVENRTNIPLFLQDISATVTMPDGTSEASVGAGTRDVDRMFHAFPSIANLRSAAFDRSATIPPGQSLEGQAIFSFPFTREQWDSRKSGKIVVSFIHQNDLRFDFPK